MLRFTPRARSVEEGGGGDPEVEGGGGSPEVEGVEQIWAGVEGEEWRESSC